MGKTAYGGHVFYFYSPKLVNHWKSQTPAFKQLCEEIGQPHGYSGMNVYLTFVMQYWTLKTAGVTRKEFKRSL